MPAFPKTRVVKTMTTSGTRYKKHGYIKAPAPSKINSYGSLDKYKGEITWSKATRKGTPAAPGSPTQFTRFERICLLTEIVFVALFVLFGIILGNEIVHNSMRSPSHQYQYGPPVKVERNDSDPNVVCNDDLDMGNTNSTFAQNKTDECYKYNLVFRPLKRLGRVALLVAIIGMMMEGIARIGALIEYWTKSPVPRHNGSSDKNFRRLFFSITAYFVVNMLVINITKTRFTGTPFFISDLMSLDDHENFYWFCIVGNCFIFSDWYRNMEYRYHKA